MQQLLNHFHELSLHPRNAQKLKGLILKMAVQGFLTSEWRLKNSISESAADILKKIKDQQNGSSKENYELAEKDIPYTLPPTWAWTKLGKLCSVKTGRKDANYATSTGKYNFYTCAQIPLKSPDYSFEGESLILPGNGANVGMVTYVSEKFEAYQRTYVLSEFSHLNPLFIKLVLDALWKENLGKQYGSAINYIKKGNITEFKIPIAPLDEQKEIVKVVETLLQEVEALKNLTEKRIKLKKDYATSALNQLVKNESKAEWQALKLQFHSIFNETDNINKLRENILQLAVQGKLTAKWRAQNPELILGKNSAENLLKEIKAEKAKLVKEKKIKKEKALPPIIQDEPPYELPEGWIWTRLQDLTQLITKGSSPKWQGVNYVDEDKGILFITSENVGNQTLIFKPRKYVEKKFNEIEPRSILKRNDILMNIVGASIGRTAIFNIEEVANINQAVTIIRLFPELIHHYFLTFFNSKTCVQYMFNNQVDNARANLSMGNISKFKIPLPTLEEQKVIVEKVNFLMNLCDQLEKVVETGQQQIEDLMQSVLKEVFEGQEELETISI